MHTNTLSPRSTPHETGAYLPAALLSVVMLSAILVAQLMPVGRHMLLVRVGQTGPQAAIAAAAAADAALVSEPKAGFAVVFGDAATIRRSFGIAVLWNGDPSCSSR